jgi:hypothetical protein
MAFHFLCRNSAKQCSTGSVGLRPVSQGKMAQTSDLPCRTRKCIAFQLRNVQIHTPVQIAVRHIWGEQNHRDLTAVRIRQIKQVERFERKHALGYVHNDLHGTRDLTLSLYNKAHAFSRRHAGVVKKYPAFWSGYTLPAQRKNM